MCFCYSRNYSAHFQIFGHANVKGLKENKLAFQRIKDPGLIRSGKRVPVQELTDVVTTFL